MEFVEGLVSIITPTYNCARFIAETIRSVQAQSYGDWEMIIVDDCSTDNTEAVVGQFADDSRIKYHCLEHNSGAAVARNTALKLARGRWIAFLDSDDLWLSEKLERQLEFMNKYRNYFSYTEYEEIDEDSHPIGKIISGPRTISKSGMFAYCWPGCLTVMYDRNIVGDIQIPAINKNNDYALWLKVIKKANCHLLKENLAKYRKRTGSISNSSYLSLIKWHYRLFRQVTASSVLGASFLTLNNLICGVIKKAFYIRRYRSDY